MISKYYGYIGWRKRGEELFHKPSLEDHKKTAEVWLKENTNSPLYEKGLKRYEEICKQLSIGTFQDLL